MSIENIKVKTYHPEELENTEKILPVEEYEARLCALAEKIFVDENSIGSGMTAEVFTIPDVTNICCKRMSGELSPINDPDTEAEYNERIKEIDDSVIIPTPIATIEVAKKKMIKNLRNEMVEASFKEKAFLMKEINGHSIADIVEGRLENPLEFLKDFDIDKFFETLKDFLVKMHGEPYRIHHRDLHYGNIMIERGTFKPAMIDFGHAAVQYGEENVYMEERVPVPSVGGGRSFSSEILVSDMTRLGLVKKQLEEKIEVLTNH